MKIHMTGEWFHTLPDRRTSVRYRPGITYEVDKNVGEMAIAAGRAALVSDDDLRYGEGHGRLGPEVQGGSGGSGS